MHRLVLRFGMVTALLAFLLSGASTVAAASPPAAHNVLCTDTYVVRWGDNLTRIAAWYGTTVSRLAALNGIVNPNRIYAGQTLCVQAASPPPQGSYYTVRWGDTLYSIALRFGVKFWDLVAANNLYDPNRIYAGQVLRIPGSGQQGTIDRANIYLIALNDHGPSGPEIGCGDSVIPVEVAISPTNAPLKASLTKLLSIKDQYYGLSGLYNALYTSDLQVTSVVIVNRQAVVHLSGSISVGGVCDEPRVRAQLQETALQFSTVDSVAIYVNGVLLEDV